jgi:hypothetical protein
MMNGNYKKGGLAKRGQGIAVKKASTGDVVQVRGVGAARARKATIY